MSQGIDWVTPDEADFLIHFSWAVVTAFVSLVGRGNVQKWKRRAEGLDEPEAPVDDRRIHYVNGFPMGGSHSIGPWTDDVTGVLPVVPSSIWPGTHRGELPLAYGDDLNLDDIVPFPSPPRSWWATTQPLEVVGGG
jgi:hypothetical protein